MTRRFSNSAKLAVIAMAVAAAVAMPLEASAHGYGYHGGHYNGYHGGYHGGYYGHGGYWSGGRWIAGAIVTGATIGLINNAFRPAPVYYGAPVVYAQPGVVYSAPPAEGRVVETTTRTVVYDGQPQTRYIRDDGYDGN